MNHLINQGTSLTDLEDKIAAMEAEEESESWLRGAFLSAIRALRQSQALADKLAWIRELTRLARGPLSLPRDALGAYSECNLSDELLRFGLRCQVQGENRLLIGRSPSAREGDFFRLLEDTLTLDPDSRRPGHRVVGDGFLRRLTPHRYYRTPTQKAVVRSTVLMPGGGTLLATMPTGAGKSLVFQLATRWWREGTSPGLACSVVIVPTVSLALDHERTVKTLPGLEGCRSLSSSLSKAQYEEILIDFQRGEIPILFLSPEAALGGAREALLGAATPLAEKPAAAQARLAGFFVDEVHIVETWGRSFRPDFQRLPSLLTKLRERNPELRTTLLSATVTASAADLLKQSYAGADHLDLSAGVARYEFDWVFHKSEDPTKRRECLLAVADLVPRPTIIYTTTREDAETLFSQLKVGRGYERVACFTGDTSGTERETIIEEWSLNQLDLIVATSAFGMGVDKSNVRTVIHACLPEDASRLYQEVGRGGRDGYQCLALCLWCADDFEVANSLSTTQWLTTELALARWSAMLDDAQQRMAIRTGQGGRQIIQARLGSAHAGLGSRTGERNREWNRTLLNLMQRAGAIEVMVVDEQVKEDPSWTFVVLKPEILSQDAQIVSNLLSIRDREQKDAQEGFKALKELVQRAEQHCVLARIFELVEGFEPQLCGHCQWCRDKGVEPPRFLHYAGTHDVWPQRPRRRETFTGGITLVYPELPLLDGGLSTLVPRLVRLGIQQFVVPDGVGECVLKILEPLSGLGLVLEYSMICHDEWVAADMPTAVLLCDERPLNSSILGWLKSLSKSDPGRVMVLVASPDLKYQERSLTVLTALAPYDEEKLDRFHEREVAP